MQHILRLLAIGGGGGGGVFYPTGGYPSQQGGGGGGAGVITRTGTTLSLAPGTYPLLVLEELVVDKIIK